LVAETVGFSGSIVTDPSKPDGTPKKLTDTTLLKSTGWSPKIGLQEGLRQTYRDFLNEMQMGALREV
jgi:GDP-L-fucose synthase